MMLFWNRLAILTCLFFFFSSRRRHTRYWHDWSSDVCSSDLVAAARWLITHPDATLDKLMEFVPGPDLPTGGVLLGLDEVRKAYETGRGVVRMRAKVETGLLEGSRGRQAITVTELPYGVGPEKIIEKITDEVTKSKRLTGISDVKDLTDRENGTRVVIECKVEIGRA